MEYSYKRKRNGYWNDLELLEFFQQSPKEEILHFLNNDMKTIKSAGNASKIWEIIYEKCGEDLYQYNTPEAHEMYKWMASIIDKVEGDNILDIGSSFGIYWKYCRKPRISVSLLDISQFAKNYFENKLQHEMPYDMGFMVKDIAELSEESLKPYDIVFSMNTLDLISAHSRPPFQRLMQKCGPEYIICGGNIFPGIDIHNTIGGRSLKHNFPTNLVHPNQNYDYGLGTGKAMYEQVADYFYDPKSDHARPIALSIYKRKH